MKKGNPFSYVKDIHIHISLAVMWALLIIPTILFWSNSILWILVISIYANIGAHISAYEAAKDDDQITSLIAKIDHLQEQFEGGRITSMTNYRRSDESLRNDVELLHAIEQHLKAYQLALRQAVKNMIDAYTTLQNLNPLVDAVSPSEGIRTARVHLLNDAKTLQFKIDFLETVNEVYYANLAVYLTEKEIAWLKETYVKDKAIE